MKVTKFNKGEMYWYINPDVKKENYLKEGENQDFLDNRPVLIISNYIFHIFIFFRNLFF